MGPGPYSIKELADLSGVSVRTLHHYDRIGLLVPRRGPNGYRLYTAPDVERLQLVLLYRACGMRLSRIAAILDDPAFDELAALEEQLVSLRRQRADIDALIANVGHTIDSIREETAMEDRERFEGMRRAALEENERRFGSEARERWGDAAVDAANEALAQLGEEEWDDLQALERRIKALLAAAMETGDATGSEAAELVRAHARWLSLHWGPGAYSPEAHRSLADGYLADERFVAYYDEACGTGATQFLRDAIWALA